MQIVVQPGEHAEQDYLKETMKTAIRIGSVLLLTATTLLAQDFGGERPPGPPGGRGRVGSGEFSSTPMAKDDVEKKVLTVLEDMARNSRGMMSVGREDGRLLRLLVESIGAKHAVELGTSHGYSAIWLGLGLRATGGKLTTFEIDEGRAKLARENFKRAGLDEVITLVLGDAHQEVVKVRDPIDLVFLDADKEGYEDYLQKLLSLLRPGGLIVAHNINRGMADPAFIKAITAEPKLETLFVSFGGGMSITMKKR